MQSLKKNIFEDSITERIFSEEINSIKENRERPSIICGNKLIEIPSKWSNNILHIDFDEKIVKSKCNNIKPLLLHTHILHPSIPSNEDFSGYNKIKNSLGGFCVAGIDGLNCFNNNNAQIMKKNWGNNIGEKFEKNGLKFWKGSNLYCDKVGHKHYCELDQGNGKVLELGVFDSIVSKGGINSIDPKESDLSIKSTINENLNCVSNGTPTLSCFTSSK